ncbi:MAG: TonB-dependent receptor, partial [Tannerella sp.]|nr:TonB-dependent receptor [Tannerella sp.]
MKNLYALFVLLLCDFGLNAQNLLTDTVTGYFVEQLNRYPQEKLYLQTDKPHYISGEKMWFRAHKVDALLHNQTNTSRYVYAELIDPLDSVVQRVKIHPDSLALFHGYMPLDEGLPEGTYTLRAYTRYMENQGEDYFFRKTIPVFDPLSLLFDVHVAFSFDDKNVRASFRFVDKQTGQSFEPENLIIRLNRKEEKKLGFDSDTTTNVAFRISETEKNGVITLTFLYNGKRYTKYVRMPLPDADFDVRFMPEGGYLLAGANNAVAFKSVNSNGLSEDVACTILSDDGEIIRKVQSLHLGMGVFNLYSEPGKKYIAECTNRKNITKRFELPAAVANHCGLKVKRIRNKVYVSVNRARDYKLPSELYLLIHIRGGVLYNEKWDPEKEYIIFEDSFFPSGVNQIVLYNADKQVIGERLVFNYSDNETARSDFSTDKTNYAAKQRIVSTVKITDVNDTPLSGNFSISVTDDKDIIPDSCSNIISAFLLTSELKGYIENPSYYLKQDSRDAADALDLLMMTQGWRRYAVPEIIRGELFVPEIPVEESQVISGKSDGMFTSVKDGYISVLAMKDSAVNTHLVQTDQKGRFELKNIDYPDSTRFIIQATTKKGRRGMVFLEIDKPQPFPEAGSVISSRELFPESLPDHYIAKADEKYLSENGMRIVNLAEIEVTATRRAPTHSAYYSAATSSRVLTAADIEKAHYTDMKMLLMQIPGIMIIG